MTHKWWEIPGISLLMLALSAVSTYPLILHFDIGIPFGAFEGGITWNRSGDPMQLLYWFWLVKENLLGAVPFDTNPFEFNMAKGHETTGLTTFPLAVLFILFSPFGDIAAYNCTIISSYILTGIFTYLLIRLYTGSRTGALLGAIIFTFAPSRINGVTGGNVYGWLFFCYPWILFFLEKGLQSKKIRYGFLAAIGLLFLSKLEPHLLYYICIFLVVYIPVRFLSLFSVSSVAHCSDGGDTQGILTWSIPRSLMTLWGSGVAVIFYSQVLFSYRDHDPFFSQYLWLILAIYPFIPVLIALCFSSIYQRLSPLIFRESFAVEAGSLLPLYLLFPLSLLAYNNISIDTTVLLISATVVVVAAKLFLLRRYLRSMLKILFDGFITRKEMIWTLVPVICTLGYIVFWIPSVKVNKFASTTAASGRTIHEVRLYSSHLSDVFLPSSNVYMGITPAFLFGALLLSLLWSLTLKKRAQKVSQQSELMVHFYVFVALFSYILALGLALGKSSLYLFLYYYLPFFDYPRISDRLIVPALFALAIIAGIMVQRIQQSCNRRRLVLFSTLVLVVAGLQLKDYNVFKATGITILDRGQDVYTHVKENIGNGLLLEIPLWPGDSHQSSLYQHYIMLDKVPRVNGYSALVRTDYVDDVFKPLAALNQGKLDKQQYEILQKLNVEFITVHNNRDVFTPQVSPYDPLTTVMRLKKSPYLKFVDIENTMYFKDYSKNNEGLYLFRVRDKELVKLDNSHLTLW